MSVVGITFRRTVGCLRNAYSTAVSTGLFLAATGMVFSFALNRAEGSHWSVPTVWASSVSPLLPALAALLGMDVWSEERRTKRIDILMSSPVSEGSLVLGKFFGVWLCVAVSLAMSLASVMALMHFQAPGCSVSVREMVMAWTGLVIQGALWSAVSAFSSSLFMSSSLAAAFSVALTVGLPRGVWYAMQAWAPGGGTQFGEMPLDAHAVDMTGGLFSSGSVVGYAMLSGLMMYATVIVVSCRRLSGRGGRRLRIEAFGSLALFIVFTVLAVFLAFRLDKTVDFSDDSFGALSKRTLGILAETKGNVSVTCLMSRSDSEYRSLSRKLRAMSKAAASTGGGNMLLRFVDPEWDVGEAARVIRSGVKPRSVVFEYGRRRAVLSVEEALEERLCASTIMSMMLPPRNSSVLWTKGHGEAAFDDYGPFGMSDIARELARDGYQNRNFDFTGKSVVTPDCALVVVAGAKTDFGRKELACLESYLRQGGRMLVMLNGAGAGGVSTLLSEFGIKLGSAVAASRSVTGTDVIVSDFADHPITYPLRGASVILDRPVALTPSAAAESGSGVDRVAFSPLATVGSDCVAAIVERGLGVGNDLGYRPTRIVAVGDTTFAMNGMLKMRANANRDFFQNAVSCLSGTGAMTSDGMDGSILSTGMDRFARRRLFVALSGVVPLTVTVVLMLIALRRRRRS